MNTTLRSLLALVLLNLSFLSASVAQSPAEPQSDSGKERFLIIVETSAAMQKRAENLQKALGSLVSSGLNKHIGEGSTIGLWTFNEKLFTGQVKLQLWTEASRQRVALSLVQFLQQQKYEKNSRLSAAWDAATNIVAHSERITIVLLTTGSEPIIGTPFDAAITESYIKNQEQLKKQNMPFVTILRATKGEFVTFAVNMPPWPLEVPEYPDGYKPVRAKSSDVVKAPIATPPAPRRVDPALLSPTNTIHLSENAVTSEPPAPPEVSVTPTNVPATLPKSIAAKPAPPQTNALPAAAATKPAEIQVQTVSAAPAQPEPTPEPNPGSDAKTKFPIITLLVAGIALLLGVMLTFIALLRLTRRSTGASLITQSMNKDAR